MNSGERVAKILGIGVCAMLILSLILLVPTVKVSAQSPWIETTEIDFGDSEEMNNVRIIGTGVPAYVELNMTETFNWNNKTALIPESPDPRQSPAMAFDSDGGVAVLFGGVDSSGMVDFEDTWEYNYTLNTWTKITSASNPPGRKGHSMAYDSKNKVVVMFGGVNFTSGPKADTWEYDVTTNQWSQPSVGGSPPSVREGHAMTYDSNAERVLLFGGMYGMSVYNDLRAYDAATNQWTNRNTGPPARTEADIAYDSLYDKTILFSGHRTFPPPPDQYEDTWQYSYGSNSWQETTPSVPGPAGRNNHAMAFDGSKTIMFGGYNYTWYELDDTWAWNADPLADDKDKWQGVGVVSAPPPTQNHDIVYDSVNDVIILFSGYGDQGWMSLTYVLETDTTYIPGGDMTSSACDSAASPPDPIWQYIQWEPLTQPVGTLLRIQLANSSNGVTWGSFVGPDGTGATHYTIASGEPIWSGHNGKQYLKYKAIFSTSDNKVSPRLEEIRIGWGKPRPMNLRVERSPPNDVTIRWDTVSGATEYHVYESQDRFALFPSGWSLTTIIAPTTTCSFPHLTDGLTHFYIVRSFDGAAEGENSTMGVKAHLDFLQPINKWQFGIRWLSLPYNSIYDKASDIVTDIEGGLGQPTRIRAVLKWNRDLQQTQFFYYSRGKWWGADFDINPGDAIALGGIIQNFQWYINGTDTNEDLSFQTGHSDWISLPYTSIYGSASDIVIDIEGGLGSSTKIKEVGKWNASAQKYEIFRWDGGAWTGDDFTIDAGEGIYLRSVSDFNWTPQLLTPP